MQNNANYWSLIIQILLQRYFSHLTTTCILWHETFDPILEPSINANVLLLINPGTVKDSFSVDIYDYDKQDSYFQGNQVTYDDLIKKYIAAIENTNCEGFLAFQQHIPIFAATFRKASQYSIWRSIQSRFLFMYVKELQEDGEEDYFKDALFKKQPNILVVEADYLNSSTFALKTNKFVGPLNENPEELYLLNTFDALTLKFTPDIDLFSPEKLRDLQGREIIVAALDYRPFVAVDFERYPKYYDHSEKNPTHLVHVDGAETRVCHTFCELYNCTMQFDTSEPEEWGTSYKNYTGIGMIGILLDGKADMATGAMYAWSDFYATLDVSSFIIRSGVTCLVPAPTRVVSWDLPTRPFKTTLWLVILSVLFLESVSLCVTRQFEQVILVKVKNNRGEWWTSYMFGFISAFKLFLSQGTDYLVTAHTLRVILFACYTLDIIITSVYGGGLSSILTLPIMEEAADSVERMYTHNLMWGATSYVWVESIRAVEDNPIIKRIASNFKTYKFSEILEKAKRENMGFAVERLTYGYFGNLDFSTPESLHHLKLMVDDIYYGYSVAMVSRLWAHLPKYNDLILAWHSSGLDKLWEWKITATYLNVNEQNQVIASMIMNFDEGPVKLGMDNFGGILLLLFLGLAVSILVFFGELVLYKMTQRKLDLERVLVV
ncbi:uncharacterized protein ACRADG_001788 [Cochliomyia hominivorax]